ncbi:MAG: hypothetical protein NT150_01005 [Bacteroidetes bacterium]|nr:hypothetical protein [Bacteroidota bacterium]
MKRKLMIVACLFSLYHLGWSQVGETKHEMCTAQFDSLVKVFSDTTKIIEPDAANALHLLRIYNTIKYDGLKEPFYESFVKVYEQRYYYKVFYALEFGKWKGDVIDSEKYNVQLGGDMHPNSKYYLIKCRKK